MGADLRSLLLWVNELPSCSGAGKESPHGKVAARSSAGATLAACYPEHAPILLFGVLQSGWRSQTVEDQLSITCRWTIVPVVAEMLNLKWFFDGLVLRMDSAAAPWHPVVCSLPKEIARQESVHWLT